MLPLTPAETPLSAGATPKGDLRLTPGRQVGRCFL